VYEYVIPDDHAGGTHWYHPHHHGSTALQVGGGAAGTILVADKVGDVPSYIADMPETLLFMQYFPIAANPSLLSIAQDSNDDMITADSFNAMNADFVLVNGLFQPKVTLQAGKWRRFRIVHSGTIATLEITLPGCDIDLLAKDGIYLRSNPRRITAIYVVAGARADVAVRCPAAGFYTMASGAAKRRRSRSLLQGPGGGGPGGGGPGGGGPGGGGGGGLFTGRLTTVFVEAATGAADADLAEFTPVFPNYLANLQGVNVDNTFTLDFGGGGGGCTINGASFAGENNPIHTMTVGPLPPRCR
jgi:FtsP/CotA-like multicopper oxidase with cupredoxin domain